MSCISCGNNNALFFPILANVIIFFLLIISLYFAKNIYINFKEEDSNQSFLGNKNNILLAPLLSYIGQSLLAFGELIMNKCILKSRKNNINQKENNEIKNYPVKLIFNDLSHRLTKKDGIKILLFSIMLLFVDISKALMNKIYEKTEEIPVFSGYYNGYQMLSLFLFSVIFYHKKFYKHQYFSIIALFILQVVLLLMEYKSFSFEALYFTFFQILISIFDSVFINYIKELMEYKFLSPYRTLYIFSMINLILLLITYFIVSYIRCDNFCYLNFNNNNYFDNIFSIFNNLNLQIILSMIFSSFFLAHLVLLIIWLLIIIQFVIYLYSYKMERLK